MRTISTDIQPTEGEKRGGRKIAVVVSDDVPKEKKGKEICCIVLKGMSWGGSFMGGQLRDLSPAGQWEEHNTSILLRKLKERGMQSLSNIHEGGSHIYYAFLEGVSENEIANWILPRPTAEKGEEGVSWEGSKGPKGGRQLGQKLFIRVEERGERRH